MAAVLLVFSVAFVHRYWTLSRLSGRIDELWAELEQAHRLRAELTPELFAVVTALGAQDVSLRHPPPPLPTASGQDLLGDPPAFERWDWLQSEMGGLMFELCQAVVATPLLRSDERARGLLSRLADSEKKAQADGRRFAETVEAYARARQGLLGRWVARGMSFPERSVKLSSSSFWAHPRLMQDCPLTAALGSTPAPGAADPARRVLALERPFEYVRPSPGPSPPPPAYERELGQILEASRETWKPCAAVAADHRAKLDQSGRLRAEGRTEEMLRLDQEIVAQLKGPLADCGTVRERIWGELRQAGVPEGRIDEAWQAYLRSFRP